MGVKKAKGTGKPSLFKQMMSGQKDVSDEFFEYSVEDFDFIPENEPANETPPPPVPQNINYVPIRRQTVANIRIPRIFTCMELPKDEIDVVFLDVDGVLNFGNFWTIQKSRMDLLMQIFSETDCYFVLSTAWRNGIKQRDELLRELQNAGVDVDYRVLGIPR